jgi:hypothetical protein
VKNTINNKSFISTACWATILLMFNAGALAETSSLSPKELTDTYIKDTTVIIRQKEEQRINYSLPVRLKVSPLEQSTHPLRRKKSSKNLYQKPYSTPFEKLYQ